MWLAKNVFFQYKSHFFTLDGINEKFAIFDLKLIVSFKFASKKECFLNEGDYIKFSFVPFSKIWLFEDNNFDSLHELSKTEQDICCFETKIRKINTFYNQFSDRSISISQKVALNQIDTVYFLKGEAYKNGNLVSVNFLFSHLISYDAQQFHQFVKNEDFFSFLENL